jgi:hypothetical protein
MTTFDFEHAKKQTVQRLEALEKIRIDFENLKTKLKTLDVGGLIEQAAQADITKIMRYAKQHDIPFAIDVADLIKQVQLPTLALAPTNVRPEQNLPFVPDLYEYITDSEGTMWNWDEDLKKWVKDEEEESWHDSGCEWQSSGCE